MDDTDRSIINEIQADFPVSGRPFMDLGNRLGLSEAEVLERVARLKREGVIRRIGGNFNSGALGFASTLCAAKVPEDKLEVFAEVVNRFPGVTHNYQRNSVYNVWFTFIAPSMEKIEEALMQIEEETGVAGIRSFPSIRLFKIKVGFTV